QAVFNELEALATDSPLVHETHYASDSDSAYFAMRPQDGTNVCHRFRIRTPGLQGREEDPVQLDVQPDQDPLSDAFDGADVVIDRTFYTPAAAQMPMEPHSTIAQWIDGRLELITGTQT